MSREIHIRRGRTSDPLSRSTKAFVLVLLGTLQLQLLTRPAQVQAIEHFRAVNVLRQHVKDELKLESSSSSSLRGSETALEASAPLHVQELWFQQRLDHFRSDPRTFSQRYFYSDQYVYNSNTDTNTNKEHKTYALLCCGGEGPDLDASVLVDSHHCSGDMLELAAILFQRHNASVHLYALEHRYYGQSYPKFAGARDNEQSSSPTTNENLVYLSSRQAVADISHFISAMQSPTTASVSWVTFGGSYPGMVAAWARLKYPHAVTAAVSSSAPIQAQLDFAAYNEHVAADFANPVVGGSSECLDVFVTGHRMLASLIQNEENHETIASAFGLCDAKALQNDKSVQLFLGDGVYQSGVQGNDPSCEEPLCNIDKVCTALLEQIAVSDSNGANDNNDNNNKVDALAWLVKEQKEKQYGNDDCTELDWQATLDYLRDPVRGQKGGMRSWLWQTCTEFGFYQTCETNSTCPWGRGYHTIEQDFEICSYAFGIDDPASQVTANIQETLDYYGGLHLAGSQILSVNGDVDPWSELAKLTTNNPDLPVLTVAGVSHHFWTHAVKPTDDLAVQFAREIIHQTVMDWLDETDEDDTDDLFDDDDDNTGPPTQRQPDTDTHAFSSSS
jgi:serine protease 16